MIVGCEYGHGDGESPVPRPAQHGQQQPEYAPTGKLFMLRFNATAAQYLFRVGSAGCYHIILTISYTAMFTVFA